MAYNFSNFKNKTKETLDWLKKEYSGIRTGQATPALLDEIKVESYGSTQPISHVASISIEDPKTLKITPWDNSQIQGIESAIQASNLGVSVATDSSGVRVIFPELTEDSRKTFVKLVKEHLEQARVSVRKEREEVLNDINKNSDISDDEKFQHKDELQKIVDGTNKEFEEIAAAKEKEVMEI